MLLKSIFLALAVVVASCSSGTAQTGRATRQVSPSEEPASPRDIARLPRVLITETWRFFSKGLSKTVPSKMLQEPDELEKLNTDEVYRKVFQMIDELDAETRGRALTRDDLRPVWGVIQHFHSRDDSTYDGLITLYKNLAELNLSAVDRMETIRLLGQDRYMRMRYAEAIELLSQAAEIPLGGLSEIDRELCYDKLGNILYHKGLALTKQSGSTDATIEAFLEIVDNPEIVEYVDASTVANIYLRLGRLFHQQQQYEEATDAFADGIKVIDQSTEASRKADRQYRISLEVEGSKSQTMADNPEDPDYQEMLERLDVLKKKLADKKYPDFDLLLRTRVLSAAKLDDKEVYVETVQDVRDYYQRKHSVTKIWERVDRKRFLDASALLVKHHLEEKNEEDAKEILLETKELAVPPGNWYYRFPKSFVDRALEKSVLDRDDPS